MADDLEQIKKLQVQASCESRKQQEVEKLSIRHVKERQAAQLRASAAKQEAEQHMLTERDQMGRRYQVGTVFP
jgi:hypothetical protein